MSQEPVQVAQELARIARENDLGEIEYRGQDFRLRLTFEYAEKVVATVSAPVGPATVAEAPPSPPSPPPVVEEARPLVRSPLAGVFYRAPRPGAPPFVEVGQTSNLGDTLCIVEAMKLMNEISAEGPMRILKILVENGAVVESGQGLFEYEPLG